MLDILTIVLAIALLMFLSFRRVNVVVIGIVAALAMAIMSGQAIVPAMTETYSAGVASFVQSNFLIFVFSVLFGKVMEETGAAASIANFLAEKLGKKYAILGVVFSGAVLVYGGVTTLVVVFSLYPIALSLFKKADLPRYLLPGAIAGGCFTFACAHFPGTPNLVNVIPTTYLGTDTMAAPVVGVITGVVVMILVCVYLLYEAQKAVKRGDHFIDDEATTESLAKAASMAELPSPLLAILPIVLILVVLNVLKWNVIVSMFVGTVLCALLFRKNMRNISGIFTYSAQNASIAIINTAVIVGFGSIVRNSAGFTLLVEKMTSLDGLPPLVSFGVTTTVLAGACGSGSGGLGIALQALADQYVAMGVNPEILHRVGAAASVGLDSLPHAGALFTLMTLSGQTHKTSYKYIFVTTVIFTLIGLVITIITGTILYPIG